MNKEGEENLDPYRGIIDRRCNKTVTGRKWMDAYMESKGKKITVQTGKEREKFRIGTSDTYISEAYYEIEIETNNLKEMVEVSVIDANILLLLVLEYQKGKKFV